MNLFHFYIPEWFFVALNLLILTFILHRLLWKRVLSILDARQQKITSSLEDAEAAERGRREFEAGRETRQAELETMTVEHMKDARIRAGQEYDRIIAEAEEKARAIIVSAESSARRERETMLLSARAEIVSAAIEAAGLLVESQMDSERNRTYVESLLLREGVK